MDCASRDPSGHGLLPRCFHPVVHLHDLAFLRPSRGTNSAAKHKRDRRIAQVTHTDASLSVIDQRRFWWDSAGNKTMHEDVLGVLPSTRNRLFAYDSADRLVQSRELATTPTAPDAWDPANPPAYSTLYDLDTLGNRLSVSGDDQAGADVGSYTLDPAADATVNQYTTTPSWKHFYDIDGNMTAYDDPCSGDVDGNWIKNLDDINFFGNLWTNHDPSSDMDGNGIWNLDDINLFVGAFQEGDCEHTQFFYNHRDQLVTAMHFTGASVDWTAQYRYDAFNRRVSKIVDSNDPDVPNSQTYFVYGGLGDWQLLEEYDAPTSSASLIRDHVYGNYIDEVLTTREYGTTDEDYYYHQDDQYRPRRARTASCVRRGLRSFPTRRPAASACPGSAPPPASSAGRSPSRAPSSASPGPSSDPRTHDATCSTSDP